MDKRHFQGDFFILDYSITHRQLLLRHCSQGGQGPNTDIVFESVYYIEMPSGMDDITLFEADEAVFEEISKKCVRETFKEYGDKVYVIETKGKRYFIGCWRYVVEENNLKPMESSIQ